MQWRSDPLSFKVPVAEMLKCSWGILHFMFRGFEMQWRSDPLSFKVSVAEMPKRLLGDFTFHVSGFQNAVEK
jgi:hypothetical protein